MAEHPASDDRAPNRLAESTSPYLLQHALNPVDWYPWGEEALSRARREDRPIFLSIGYSSCHWCHVMAHESFEDPAVAALLNEGFVSIKVDREERPDLDDVYMAATLAMNGGQGGWPMSVFLTPDQKPFFAGTYFPPEDRWGRPGFVSLLGRIVDLWARDRASIVGEAEHVTELLRSRGGPPAAGALGEDALGRALAQLEDDYDARYGGFGRAPKFPPATQIALLLRLWRRFGHAHALEMARATLEAMARGGIHDHIGGGFHRYATDERWLVPHFEKMLYDNALLAKAYLEGFQATGEDLFRQVAAATLDYVLRDMTAPEGGFYSATDADSDGEEGKYFVWTPGEVAALLGEPDARRVCAHFDISEAGNWEGKSIPNRLDPEGVVAWRLGEPLEAIAASVAAGRPRLLAARAGRKAPGLDDKIVTAWNGLMVGALALGARALGDERYLAAARRAADFLLASLRGEDSRLRRTWRQGRSGAPAFLEDYVCLAEGLIDLYEAGAPRRYLEEALALGEAALREFVGADGALWSTAERHETLILRPRDAHDGATPSANATAAHVLTRLSYHFGRPDLREAARRAIEAHGAAIALQPRAFAKSLLVVDLLDAAPDELTLAGVPGSADYEELRREVGRRFVPRLVMAHSEGDSAAAALPLLEGRGPVEGRAALYVCRSAVCLPPIVSAADVKAALER